MKDWKTTIVGAILAACVAIYPSVEQGSVNWPTVILGGLIAFLSYLMGDKGAKRL